MSVQIRTDQSFGRSLDSRRCCLKFLPENLGLRAFKLLVGQHSAIPEVGELDFHRSRKACAGGLAGADRVAAFGGIQKGAKPR